MTAAKPLSVETSHGRVSALDHGAGPATLLLIHANSLCKEVFLPLLDDFADRVRLIAIDLPGHGQSADAVDARRTYSLGGYSDCVAEVLERLGIERAAVLGWSLGGNVGFELTRRFKGTSGLIAICSVPFSTDGTGGLQGFRPNPKLAMSGASALSNSEIDEFVTLVSDYETPPEPFWRAAVARTDGRARAFMSQSLLAPGAPGQRQLAEMCPVPLALVVGANDAFVDLDYLSTLTCPNLWSGGVVLFDGQGHAPHIHARHRFNQVLEKFLASLPSG